MKLPIFKAFLAGWAYLAAHPLTVFKILWLPTLLLMAAYAYFMPSMLDAQMQFSTIGEGEDPSKVFEALGPMMKSVGWLYLLMAIVYPMMIAGVLRHVVRGEAPALPFYFQFFGDEFRVLIAYILYLIMIVFLSVVGFLAVLVLAYVSGVVGTQVGGIITLLLVVAFVSIFIWFLLRLSVFFPAAIGSRSLGIPESWRVTKGNALGLLVYWILWGVAIIVVASVFMIFIAADYFQFIGEMIAAGQDEAAQQEISRRMLEMQRDQWNMARPGFWLFALANYLFTIVYTAMWTVASGVAYRYLSGETERAA